MNSYYKLLKCNLMIIGLAMSFSPAIAQTEQDALMMPEKNLCVAATAGFSSWTRYWEGTFKRENDNIGRLSTKSAMLMLNYGLTNNLNLLATVPYVSVKASAGTLSPMSGFQDLSVAVKWKPVHLSSGSQKFSLFTVAGFSAPTNDYDIDFMPMCIGMGSKVLSGRLIADVQHRKLYATASAGYFLRSNVTIDREAYYTTRQINSSEVKMPDAGNFQFKTGYRSRTVIAEAFIDNVTTFGGFDIRKNDMPFVSNRMNSTRVGLETKLYLPSNTALGFHATAFQTIAGRNMGSAAGIMAGFDYAFNLKKTNKN